MAFIKQNPSGTWTAAIDRKGHKRLKKTHKTEALAKAWAAEQETMINKKKAGVYVAPTGTVGDLVKRYIADYGRARGGWSESKQRSLDKIIEQIGHVRLQDFTKQTLINYGKEVANTRGVVGTFERLSYISKIFKLALPTWEIDAPVEEVRQGMAVLRGLGVIGTTAPRDRIIQEVEIAKIKRHLTPLAQDAVDVLMILPFRVGELCAICWEDINEIDRSVRLFRKDTTQTKTTFKKAQWVTLPVIETIRDGKIVEVDTFDLIAGRDRKLDRPFPIERDEMSRLFSHAHKIAGIEDIHLHDCRAEAMSSLFAQGFDVSIVCHLSGHTDWKVVQRHYARLKPRKLHDLFKRQARINRQDRINQQMAA